MVQIERLHLSGKVIKVHRHGRLLQEGDAFNSHLIVLLDDPFTRGAALFRLDDLVDNFVDAVSLIRFILLHHDNHIERQLVFERLRLHLRSKRAYLVVLLNRFKVAYVQHVILVVTNFIPLF